MRSGKPGGGKGALVREDQSLTLASGNDQTLFQPLGFVPNGAKAGSDGVEVETSPTVRGGGGNTMPHVAQPLGFVNQAGDTNLGLSVDLMPPLTASHGNPGMVLDQYAVRKLMPVECERLQGFPDGWTEGFADTTRYRMLGNAVAVPVVEWIVARLMAIDGAEQVAA